MNPKNSFRHRAATYISLSLCAILWLISWVADYKGDQIARKVRAAGARVNTLPENRKYPYLFHPRDEFHRQRAREYEQERNPEKIEAEIRLTGLELELAPMRLIATGSRSLSWIPLSVGAILLIRQLAARRLDRNVDTAPGSTANRDGKESVSPIGHEQGLSTDPRCQAPKPELPIDRARMIALLLGLLVFSVAISCWLLPAMPTDHDSMSVWIERRIPLVMVLYATITIASSLLIRRQFVKRAAQDDLTGEPPGGR